MTKVWVYAKSMPIFSKAKIRYWCAYLIYANSWIPPFKLYNLIFKISATLTINGTWYFWNLWNTIQRHHVCHSMQNMIMKIIAIQQFENWVEKQKQNKTHSFGRFQGKSRKYWCKNKKYEVILTYKKWGVLLHKFSKTKQGVTTNRTTICQWQHIPANWCFFPEMVD